MRTDAMTLKQLRSLISVARTGSLTQTARFLNQTPPTIHSQIKNLEVAAGQELVSRATDGSGFYLTRAGEALLIAAHRIEANLSHAERQLQALIPALTLGIPGTAVAAVMLGGLMIHGLQPGPMLFRENPDVVFGFMWQFLFGAILLVFLGGSLATNSFARLLNLPRPLLGSVIIVLMLIGVYSIHGRMFDVYLMLGFGAIGYVMDKLKFPLPPVVLGLILGAFAEENLRLALRIGRGDWTILFQNVTSLVIVALTIAVIVGPLIKRRYVNKRLKAELGSKIGMEE